MSYISRLDKPVFAKIRGKDSPRVLILGKIPSSDFVFGEPDSTEVLYPTYLEVQVVAYFSSFNFTSPSGVYAFFIMTMTFLPRRRRTIAMMPARPGPASRWHEKMSEMIEVVVNSNNSSGLVMNNESNTK